MSRDFEAVKAMLRDAELKARRFEAADDEYGLCKHCHMGDWECGCFDEDDYAATVLQWFAAQQPSDGFQMLFEMGEKIGELEAFNKRLVEYISADTQGKKLQAQLVAEKELVIAKNRRIAELEAELAAAKAEITALEEERDFWLSQTRKRRLAAAKAPATASDGWQTFIQWKGTDVCMDIICPGCGEHDHIDAGFAYHVECRSCGQVYRVGTEVSLTAVDAGEAADPIQFGDAQPAPQEGGGE